VADWRKTLVGAEATIRDVIGIIDTNDYQIALIVDAENRLVGSVTDGDIRRALLRGASLNDPLTQVMNGKPISVPASTGSDEIAEIMARKVIRQMPLLDDDARVCGLVHVDFLSGRTARRDNLVVFMAGGLGSRLRPLTEDIPKPMIKVGDKPLLEAIFDNFIRAGFYRFAVSVNYKGNIIKDHFGDGSSRGVEITYIEESEPLGTAGSLRLLKEEPTLPVIVMNGDVLTSINIGHLLDFHAEMGAVGTMAVREYDFQVPYGVVQTENSLITAIDEKPVHVFFVNAGIYVLDPAAFGMIPASGRFDMTSLFAELRAKNMTSVAFPIREYWLDIGRHDDLDQARREIREIK